MDKTNSLASSLTAGLCGAAALTAIHQLATRVTDDAPRMDVLGERAISRGLEAAGNWAPPQPVLHWCRRCGVPRNRGGEEKLAGRFTPTELYIADCTEVSVGDETRGRSREPNAVVPETEEGTTAEA